VSPVSQSTKGNADLILEASALSASPRTIFFFLLAFGRFNSRKLIRVSEATPSETSFISLSACLLFLEFVSTYAFRLEGEKIEKVVKNILERQETGKFNHLAKLRKIIHTILNLLQAISNAVSLVSDFED
jgi:hypothetical protein